MAKKKKIKTKVIYKEKKENDGKIIEETKKEISTLEEQRGKLGGGVRNFLRKAALNKQINDKRQILKTEDKIKNLKKATQLENLRADYLQAKAKSDSFRKANQVNFNDFGLPNNSSKSLKIEDLY